MYIYRGYIAIPPEMLVVVETFVRTYNRYVILYVHMNVCVSRSVYCASARIPLSAETQKFYLSCYTSILAFFFLADQVFTAFSGSASFDLFVSHFARCCYKLGLFINLIMLFVVEITVDVLE